MKLNHVNLTVTDVAETRRFLENYFGLRSPGGRKKNFDVLFDDDGLVLTLIGAGKGQAVSYSPTFHIGFMQPCEEHVNELNRRLKEDGFDVEPRSGGTAGPLRAGAGRVRRRGAVLGLWLGWPVASPAAYGLVKGRVQSAPGLRRHSRRRQRAGIDCRVARRRAE